MVFDRNMLGFCSRRVDNLTREQLAWFAGLAEDVEIQTRFLAEVTEGVASMVSDDKTGRFQSGQRLDAAKAKANKPLSVPLTADAISVLRNQDFLL